MEHQGMECFGKELDIARNMGIGGCIAADIDKDTLYVIGRNTGIKAAAKNPDKYNCNGCLYIMDISDRKNPDIIGGFPNIGNVRQIKISKGIAYVVSREDGMFIIDVRNPRNPCLLAHYDSLEFATGIFIAGNVAFIANRLHGVDLVDISVPEKPVHISTLRSEEPGYFWEAQSVYVHDGYLYASNWGGLGLVICDVKNPYKPRIVSKTPVDGRSDGIFVKDGYCYIVTGHHARNISNLDNAEDPAYGMGNGLEIYNVENPENPIFVSRVKFNRFYKLGNDMWSVIVSNGRAYVAHTFNGVFILDVSNPQKPEIIARCVLPFIEAAQVNSPVGGIAICDEYIYAAGIFSDLHIIKAEGLIAGAPAGEDFILPSPMLSLDSDVNPYSYKTGGQVYSAAVYGDAALIAAGSSGIHVVEMGTKIKKYAEYQTQGFALDIKIVDNKIVYVAEGFGGMSVWHLKDDFTLEQIGRYKPDNPYSIKQVVIPKTGKYAMLQVGSNLLQILDISDPKHPNLILEDSHLGLLYKDQIGDGILENRYACCFWHVTGIHWYDLLSEEGPIYSNNYNYRLNPMDGLAFLDDKHIILIHNKSYVCLDRNEDRAPNALEHYGVNGLELIGKPCISNNIMTVSNNCQGVVSVVDISDVNSPRKIKRISLEGNPGISKICGNRLIIPAGYQGLIVQNIL